MIYFKDRLPDPMNSQNERFYDAVDSAGAVKLANVKLVRKNNIPTGKEGTPLSAANMNFASGNVELPVGAAAVKQGDILAMSGGGVVAPANAKRTQAAAGVNTQWLRPGILKINDTSFFLWTYSGADENELRIGTVNWAAKTVSLSAATNQSLYRMSAAFEQVTPSMFCLIYPASSTSAAPSIQFWTYSGGAVTKSSVLSNVGYTGTSKPVKYGNNSVLAAVAGDSAGFCGLKLITYSGSGAPVVAGSAAVGWITSESQILGLYSCDGGESSYVLIASSGATTYALPVTVSGTTISLGVQQALTNTIGSNLYYFTGSTSTTVWTDHILMASGNQIQAARINSSGVVTVGPKYTVPVTFVAFSPTTLMNNHIAHVHFRDADTAIITGAYTLPDGQMAGVMLEVTRSANYVSSGNALTVTEYRPFSRMAPQSNYYPVYHAFENAANPGEFLLADDISVGTATSSFYFGYDSDTPNSRAVVGIALENANTSGNVRVQVSGKYLPEIYAGRAALVTGQAYTAGDNGSLSPVYQGSAATVLAVATSAADLLFFGATSL
jgi:hypothetical protein